MRPLGESEVRHRNLNLRLELFEQRGLRVCATVFGFVSGVALRFEAAEAREKHSGTSVPVTFEDQWCDHAGWLYVYSRAGLVHFCGCKCVPQLVRQLETLPFLKHQHSMGTTFSLQRKAYHVNPVQGQRKKSQKFQKNVK